VCPYWHSFAQKNKIENIIHELLEVGVIHPSTSPYSSPMVMVLKKEGTRDMCPYFRAHNKLTIKDKFHTLVIDDLFDEVHRDTFFTKLDLSFGYHNIWMKEVHIPQIDFHIHEVHYEFLVMDFVL
jgi:hypothetical protein